MSENDDVDPYLEYQQFLGKVEDETTQTQTQSPAKAGLPSLPIDDGSRPQEHVIVVQSNNKDLVYMPKVTQNEHLKHMEKQRVDQTIKRTLQNRLMSPQYVSQNQKTKNQIRMKIILENNRLKASIQTLRQDLETYRSNQIKIAGILKQSKQKINGLKRMVKEKSKRISELADKNIELRGKVEEMEGKLNHMNSYSQWQEGQVRDLKKELQEQRQQKFQEAVLQNKIERLEQVLKNYESQVQRYEERFSNTFSKSSHEGDIPSSEYLQDRPSEHWGTINQLQIKDIEDLKHRQTNHEQNQRLANINANLKIQLNEVERKLQETTSELNKIRAQYERQSKDNVSKRENLEDQMGVVLKKSLNLDSEIKIREATNAQLEEQLQKLKVELEGNREKTEQIENKYNVQIQQFNKVIENKEEMIVQLKQRLAEKQATSKREVTLLELEIQEKEQKYSQQIQQIHLKLEELNRKNTQLQNVQENYKIRLEHSNNLIEEHEERQKEVRQFLLEKGQIEQELVSFKDAYARTQEETKILTERLKIAQETIQTLEEEKVQYENQLEKYSKDINDLKVLLSKLSRNYTEPEESPNQKAIQEQQEQEEGSLENEQNNDRSNSPSPQESSPIASHPLEEQEQLSEPLSEPYYESRSNTSDLVSDLKGQIQELRKENKQVQQKYKKYIEVLKEEFNIEKVELQYQLDQERENDEQKGQKVEKLSNSVQLLIIEIRSLRNKLQQTQQQLVEAESQLKSLNIFIGRQSEELKTAKKDLLQLQVNFQKQKHQKTKLTVQVQKLQQEKKQLECERQKVVDLENQIQKIKYDYMVESSRNSQQFTKQLDELKNQLSAELQRKIEEENKLFFSQQIIQKEKEIQSQNKQTVQNFQLKIEELKNSIQTLSSTNDHIMAEMEKLRAKKIQFEEQKKNLEKKIEQQEKELCKMKDLVEKQKELEAEVENYKLQKEETRLDLERVKSENEVYRCELGTKKAENQTMKSKLSLIEQEMKQAQEQHDKSREQLRENLNTLEIIIKEQKQHIEKQSFQRLKQSQNFIHLNSKTKVLENEKDTLSRQIQELQSLIEESNQQLDLLKKEKQELKEREELIEEENKELHDKNKELQEKLQKIVQEQNIRNSELMNMKMSLELSQTSHKEEVNYLMSSFTKQKESQLTVKLEQIEKLNSMIVALKLEMTQLQQRQKAVEGQYEQRIRETEKEKEELLLKNCQSCAKIEELNLSLFSFSETMKIKSSELQQKQQSLTDIQAMLNNKKLEQEEYSSKISQLENALRQQSKEFTVFRDNMSKEKKKREDEIEIAQKMLHDIEDEYTLKINKLNKQLSNHKVLLQQAQKQNSFKLEQSNRSITNVKNQLKVYIDLMGQKEEELKEIKTINSSLKETNQKMKKEMLRVEEDKIVLSKEKEASLERITKIESQLLLCKQKINDVKTDNQKISSDNKKKQEAIQSLSHQIEELQAKGHQATIYSKEQQKQIQQLQKTLNSEKQTVIEMKEELSNTHSKLEEQIIKNKKLQYQLQMLEDNLAKAKEKLTKLEDEKEKEDQFLTSSRKIIDGLEQDKEQLNTMLTSIQKEHSIRIQNLREQQRNHYLLMQRKYTKEVEQLCEQISILRNQRDSFKQMADKNKKGDKTLQEEIQSLKQRIKQDDQWLNSYQEERNQLKDKITQITQDNNDINEVVESLRNDLMFKNDQIYDLKQQIERLTEELNRVGASYDSSKSIPLSIQTDRVALEDLVEKLEAVNRQLITKNEILQNQLNDKIKKERDLIEQLQKYREKEVRDRNNSSDSRISKSKFFGDQQSQHLENTVQTLKLQLEEAQAYIHQLEDECQQYANSQGAARTKILEDRINNLEKNKQELKMKVEEQEAYIEHLETDNIKASIISKRSTKSKKIGKHLYVDKDHSVISHDNSQQVENTGEFNKQIYNKINMINQFIESYKKDNSSLEREEEFRKTLNNPYLDELLNTIFYKLEKESNTLKEKQHEIAELQMECEELREELKSSKDILQKLTNKIELYDNIQKKYEETKIMLEEALIHKLKQESHIAEKNRIIQELSDKSYDNSKEKALKYSGRNMRKEDDKLSVLKEADQEEQSQSMMDPDLQSEIPSEVHNSRQFIMSAELPMRTALSQRLNMNKVVSIEGQIIYDRSTSIDFLQRLLDEIDKIQNQMAYIQLDLEEKGDLLADLLEGNKKSELNQKLEEIESKVSQNDKDLRSHYQKTQQELILILKDILKYRESQDQYGLQSQKRHRIQQCLNVLERELVQSSQINEEDKVQEIQLFGYREKKRLSSIQEEASSDSKNHPKTERVDYRSDESQEVNQLRKQNQDLVQQLRKTNMELTDKERTILKMNQIIGLVNKQIGSVFEEILMNVQDNKYLIDQIDSIKKYLAFVFSEDNLMSLRDRNPSPQKLNESGRMILMDSKRKSFDSDRKKQHVNHFEELLRLSNSEFVQQGQELANEHIKTLQKRLEEMTQVRYEDCMDFLLCQESLILSILKKSEQESAAEQTMEKLASKFTKQEMANIIENCHNPVEARKILNRVLIEDQEKSVSEENDFSPDPQKLQQIREIVYPHPSELSLSIHNQLLKILMAPTRQVFYDLIEQFYKMLRRFQDSIKEQADQRDSQSQSNSIQMKKILQDPVTDQDFKEMQKFKLLEYKNLKGRSGSCRIPGSETNMQ